MSATDSSRWWFAHPFLAPRPLPQAARGAAKQEAV